MEKIIIVIVVIFVGLSGLGYPGVNFISDVKAQAEEKATKCISYNGKDACLTCAGKGKIASETCYTCKGTGKCTGCNGAGTVLTHGKTSRGISTAPTR